MATPFRPKNGKLILKCDGVDTDFSCETTGFSINTDVDEADKIETLGGCTYGGASTPNDTVTINALQFLESSSLVAYSWKYRGCECDFEWWPDGNAANKWTGKVVMQAFDFGGEVGEDLSSSKDLTVLDINPPTAWGYTGFAAQCATTTAPDKGAAAPGDSFTEASITAEDALNAGALAGLGFVANPLTAWTAGQSITVSTFSFHWDGTDWQPGVAV